MDNWQIRFSVYEAIRKIHQEGNTQFTLASLSNITNISPHVLFPYIMQDFVMANVVDARFMIRCESEECKDLLDLGHKRSGREFTPRFKSISCKKCGKNYDVETYTEKAFFIFLMKNPLVQFLSNS